MDVSNSVVIPNTEEVIDLLGSVIDPELPIDIVNLGMVADVEIFQPEIIVSLRPTFVGCPARNVIARRVEIAMQGAYTNYLCQIKWQYDPQWDFSLISEKGQSVLREHGVSVPKWNNGEWTVSCPYCGDCNTAVDSSFGASLCRAIYYCKSCRNSFDIMRRFPVGPQNHVQVRRV